MSRDDDKAFIFTLKNPHGVEPTRFMKDENDHGGIICKYNEHGPAFGFYYQHEDQCTLYCDIYYAIYIDSICNKENCCRVSNTTYECHKKYGSLLYVNANKFTVLDYEVYGIDYQSKYSIDHLYKYSDIIWEYITTYNISDESLKQFDDEQELLNDLDNVYCYDSSIRLKISRYYFKNPSKFLPNTQLVSQQYDSYLKEWVGDYKWKLIYRASEDGYSGESFHEYCDDRGPTLIIIKSSGGWLFGGYTTKSWKERKWCMYNDMIYNQ